MDLENTHKLVKKTQYHERLCHVDQNSPQLSNRIIDFDIRNIHEFPLLSIGMVYDNVIMNQLIDVC